MTKVGCTDISLTVHTDVLIHHHNLVHTDMDTIGLKVTDHKYFYFFIIFFFYEHYQEV